MTLEGTVVQGTIVLDEPEKLPEGARVTVIVHTSAGGGESLRDVLLRHAGCMEGLPPDMAEQHDHYIHGTQRR